MLRNNTDQFKIVASAVNKLVDFIAPTFGANHRKVLSKVPNEPSLAVDDGFRIAIDFKLDDPLEQAVIEQIQREIKKFNQRFGEGTTGFLIILRALVNELAKLNFNAGIVQELKLASKKVEKALKKASKKMDSKEDLQNIVLTSYSDKRVAKLIADFAFESGPEGKLAMEYSPTTKTYIEKVDYYDLKGGFLDGVLPRQLDNPYVLLTDQTISDGQAIVSLMDKILTAGHKNLVIVANKIEGTALATLLQNYRNGVFNTTAIRLPFGSEVLGDLQLIVGGEVHLASVGQDIGTLDVSQLGRAKKVIAFEDNSSFVSNKRNKKEIDKAVSQLQKEIKADPRKSELLGNRIAKLKQLVAVIKIGSPSSEETLAIQYKVEDAIHAVKLAQTGGGVPGAGDALAKVKTSSAIMNKALQAPKKQLIENDSLISPYAIDPTDVLIGQVEHATSLASLLFSLCGIQVEEPKENGNEQKKQLPF